MLPRAPRARPAGSQTTRELVELARGVAGLAGAAGEGAPHPRGSGSPVVFIVGTISRKTSDSTDKCNGQNLLDIAVTNALELLRGQNFEN